MVDEFGIKVSQPGFDVKTAKKEELVFSSEYDTPKVFISGSGTVLVPFNADIWTPGSATVEIAHNLNYLPAFFVFVNNPVWADSGRLTPYTWRAIGSPSHNQPNYSVDTTKLYIKFYNPDIANKTFSYRYFIFYNQLT